MAASADCSKHFRNMYGFNLNILYSLEMHSGHDHTLLQQLITIIFIVHQSISVAYTQGSTVYNLIKQHTGKLHALNLLF